MKKLLSWQIIPLVLVLVIFLIPLFHSGVYKTHDGEANIARFAAYYNSFLDLQFPLRWAGNLNFGYGSPVFIFYYPLPGYLSLLFHVLGFSFQDIYKIFLGGAFLLNGLAFYIWSKKLFKNEVAIIASIIYAVTPYHLLNMYVRGDVAELIALALVPLVFAFIENFFDKEKFSYLLYGGIFYALLIMAHNGISLMFTPLLLIYCFFKAKNKNILLKSFIIFALGLALASFFWLPAILEARYVNAKFFIGDNFKNHFLNFKQIVFSDWGFGPDVNGKNGLSPQIGIIYMLTVLLSGTVFFKNFKKNKMIFFWFLAFLIFTFLTTSYSSIFWQNLPIMKLLEFPWRFMSVSSFIAVVIIGYFLNFVKKRVLVFLFLSLFIISVIPFIGVREYENKDDKFYESYPYTTYFHGEASSIWTAGDFSKKADNQFEIISGSARITNINKKSNSHTFDISVDNNSKILDNTVYFPGWRVMVDNKKVPIEFQDMNHRGLITFAVPKGQHSVRVGFGESPVRLAADIVSLIAFILLLSAIVVRKKIKTALNIA